MGEKARMGVSARCINIRLARAVLEWSTEHVEPHHVIMTVREEIQHHFLKDAEDLVTYYVQRTDNGEPHGGRMRIVVEGSCRIAQIVIDEDDWWCAQVACKLMD